MINWYYSLILFFLLVTACQPSGNNTVNDPSVDQVRLILENYYQTMSDRNWERYKAFFSADATLTTIWQAEPDSAPGIFTSTISEFIAQTGEGPDSQPIFEERMLGSDISVRNNLAQAWVKYEAKFGSPDSLMEWQGTDLFSFIKHQEDWKIVALVYASE